MIVLYNPNFLTVSSKLIFIPNSNNSTAFSFCTLISTLVSPIALIDTSFEH
jgi:hypothetical protein